jgi:hypothetical protein
MSKAIGSLLPSRPDAITARDKMKILLISFEDDEWAAIRLVKALHERGVRVATLCALESAMTQSRFASRNYALADVNNARSIEWALGEAMHDWRPALVLPGDQRAVDFLHALTRRARSGAHMKLDEESLAVLSGSLGDYENYNASS